MIFSNLFKKNKKELEDFNLISKNILEQGGNLPDLSGIAWESADLSKTKLAEDLRYDYPFFREKSEFFDNIYYNVWKSKVAIHCPDINSTVKFVQLLEKYGFTFNQKQRFSLNWNKYKKNTCYILEKGIDKVERCHKLKIKIKGIKIIPFTELENMMFK